MKLRVADYNQNGYAERTTGLIAQDTYNVYAPAVSVGGADVQKNPWGIDYGKLTPLIIQ
jgi:hypothetical protein